MKVVMNCTRRPHMRGHLYDLEVATAKRYLNFRECQEATPDDVKTANKSDLPEGSLGFVLGRDDAAEKKEAAAAKKEAADRAAAEKKEAAAAKKTAAKK